MIEITNSKIIRRFKCGYNIHEEIWSIGDKHTVMKQAYTPKGDYIGSIQHANILCNKLGIKPQKINKKYNSCNIGFSEKNQKWYGWLSGDVLNLKSTDGFGIGSRITKNSNGYRASTPKALYEQYTRVLDETGFRMFDPEDVKITKTGIRITTYAANTKPIYNYIKCGRGEWEAKTLNDAKRMAIATVRRII